MNDAGSEASSMPPRPKSRPEHSAKYNNLSYWRARKLVFYKNGDPFFPGLEFRFKPGRDVGSLDAILDKLSLRLDLPHGARYIFSMDGERKTRLEELEDGNSYVVSSYKTFKVRFTTDLLLMQIKTQNLPLQLFRPRQIDFFYLHVTFLTRPFFHILEIIKIHTPTYLSLKINFQVFGLQNKRAIWGVADYFTLAVSYRELGYFPSWMGSSE